MPTPTANKKELIPIIKNIGLRFILFIGIATTKSFTAYILSLSGFKINIKIIVIKIMV